MWTLPDFVKAVLDRLQSHGYEAYVVGGAVRDALLGDSPGDFDITTAARPETVQQLFSKTVPTGLAHGTVTVISDGHPLEVTTYRQDGPYSDARHPDAVSFRATLSEDLARRDFTVNAMAFDGEHLVDEHGGQTDLRDRILRTVGDPDRRFAEDALRILRCFRFASQLDFSVEAGTLAAALDRVPTLAAVSRERIKAELCKLLGGRRPSRAADFFAVGGLSFLGLPPLSLPENFDCLPPDPLLRLAVLLRGIGPNAESWMTALKASNAETEQVMRYEALLNGSLSSRPADIKRALGFATPREIENAAAARERLTGDSADGIAEQIQTVLATGEPYRLSMLAVSGADLTAIGLQGPAVGKALEELLAHVIEHPEDNRKEILLSLF